MTSFFDQFSIGFKLRNDKQNKLKDNKLGNKKKLFRTKTFTKKGNLSAQLAQNLISLGYSLDSIMCLMKLHNFSNVEEALNLLEKDPVTKLYNHYFFDYKKNSYFRDSKSDNAVINVKNEFKRQNKNTKIGEKCRICGGIKEEHINEKDEFNKELEQERKKYEKDQYYEFESTNFNRKEKNKIDMKIKVIERVKTLENKINLNKDRNKYMILNLNNNIHKYYIRKRKNNDNSQSSMLLHNSKTQIGVNDDNFIILNKQNNNLNKLNQINKETIYNKENNKNKKSQNTQLISESKIDLNNNENNLEEKDINDINQIILPNSSENENIINGEEKENSVNLKLQRFGINQETINQFKNNELCKICCSNMINKENIAQKYCLHYFCDECIKRYMTYQINNGIVLEIKCIMKK